MKTQYNIVSEILKKSKDKLHSSIFGIIPWNSEFGEYATLWDGIPQDLKLTISFKNEKSLKLAESEIEWIKNDFYKSELSQYINDPELKEKLNPNNIRFEHLAFSNDLFQIAIMYKNEGDIEAFLYEYHTHKCVGHDYHGTGYSQQEQIKRKQSL